MKKSVFSRLLKELKPFVFALVVSLLCALVTVICSLAVPMFQGEAVDVIVGKGNVDFTALYDILKPMGMVIVICGIFTFVMNRINNYVTYRIVQSLRDKAFGKINTLSFPTLDKYSKGDLLSRITSDAESVGDGLLMGFTSLFTGVMTILITILFMVKIHWFEALLVVILTPASFIVAKFVASKTFKYFSGQSEIRGKETSYVQEMIENQKLVRAFGYEKKAIEDFEALNIELRDTGKRATFFSSLVNPTSRAMNNTIYAIIALTGAMFVLSGGFSVGAVTVMGMTVGNLTAFLSYTTQYSKPFNEISSVVTELQNAFACAKRLFEIIDEEDPVIDKPKSEIPQEKSSYPIRFDSVDFSYDKTKKLIQNLNLDVKPGQKIAIVGPTGAGKTTLIQLLMKFYEPDEGEIYVDGSALSGLDTKWVRENFGMVLQDTWIMEGSIRENLLFGRRDISDEEMIDAAKASGAHSFIRRLPHGYDTILKSGGEGISQGQRQLLCITRVMLNVPPMLILDEATSSIDTRTELKIQAAFGTMMSGRTTFIVAHRLSTVRSADKILVIRNGNVVEIGNHEELLAQKGFYYELHTAQYE